MLRNVQFFRLNYEYIPFITGTEEHLKQKFISAITKHANDHQQYDYALNQSQDAKVIIEMLDVCDEYLFGIIGKLDNLKEGVLKRLRDKKDISIISTNSSYYIENYTYFIIRLSDLLCAVLSNQSAPSFKLHFRAYLLEMIPLLFLSNLYIVTVLDDRIKYKINEIQNIDEINMIFDVNSILGNDFFNFNQVFNASQSDLVKANIKLSLKINDVNEKTRKLLLDSELIESDFDKFEVHGLDKQNKYIQFELVKRILSKRVEINIDEKYLKSNKDLDEIKRSLILALPTT